MEHADQYRRKLIKGFVGAAALQSLPRPAAADTPRLRLEWQQFKITSQYQSFKNAIASMRLNSNPSSRGSLQYWANVHLHYCPHGSPYFISWHRGYLYFFEQQLRLASGDPTLNLPYWDYFKSSTVPAEFTDSSAGNPLYLTRTGANVYNALTLWPFAPEVYNFQRGTTNSFEERIESAPHNPVHDLIGGIMSTMQSPLDPIFCLHHANIDRLTHAWALPDGKGIPDSAFPYSSTNSSPYWAGSNVYAPDLSMERYRTLIPTWLGYDYANDTVPTSLPPLAVTAQNGSNRLPLPVHLPSNRRPLIKTFTPAPGRQISPTRRSLAGEKQLAFDETSFSTHLRFNKKDALELSDLVERRRDGAPRPSDKAAASVKLVIDVPRVSEAGRLGGYFYTLYLNMPAVIDTEAVRESSFIGTIGAFQIAGASHHGPGRLEFDITDLLVRQGVTSVSDTSISWIRVDGDNPPAGQTISVQETRIELSYETEPVEPPRLKGAPGHYG
jgi:tyrosinase